MTNHNINEKHGLCAIYVSTRLYGSVEVKVSRIDNNPVLFYHNDFDKGLLCLNEYRILEM